MVSEGTVRPLKSATSVTHLLPPTDTYRLPVAIDRFSGFLTKLATRPPLSWFRLPTLIPLLGPPNLHNPNRLFPVAVPIPGLVRYDILMTSSIHDTWTTNIRLWPKFCLHLPSVRSSDCMRGWYQKPI